MNNVEKRVGVEWKFLSLTVCSILIIAIMGWVMPLVASEEAAAEIPILAPSAYGETRQEILDFFAEAKDGQKLMIYKSDDGKYSIERHEAVTGRGTGTENFGVVESVDDLKELFGDNVDENGVLNLEREGKKFSVNLDSIPEDVNYIKITSAEEGNGASVVYSMKEPGSFIEVSGEGVTLVEEDGKIKLAGYNDNLDIILEPGEDSQIWVPGRDGKGISYIGDAKVTVGDGKTVFQSTEGGNVEFVGNSSDNFIVRNSNVIGEGYELDVGANDDGLGIYIGDLDKIPEDQKEKLAGRSIQLKDGVLSGNLEGLKKGEGEEAGEELIFRNKGEEAIKVDSSLTDTITEVPAGEDVKLSWKKDKDGKEMIGAEVGTFSGATSSGDDKTDTPTGNEPDLPVGPGDPTSGTPPNSSGVTPPGTTPPGTTPPPGGGGGDSGGKPKWLLWAAIIGGIALAAMLLMGGKKEEKKEPANQSGIDDGGENYMGRDNGTTTSELRSREGRDNKSAVYNPTGQVNGTAQCVCDETGCRNCPDDDCFSCSGATQGSNVSVSGSSTNSTSSTATT
jgi:hypothetical protein